MLFTIHRGRNSLYEVGRVWCSLVTNSHRLITTCEKLIILQRQYMEDKRFRSTHENRKQIYCGGLIIRVRCHVGNKLTRSLTSLRCFHECIRSFYSGGFVIQARYQDGNRFRRSPSSLRRLTTKCNVEARMLEEFEVHKSLIAHYKRTGEDLPVASQNGGSRILHSTNHANELKILMTHNLLLLHCRTPESND